MKLRIASLLLCCISAYSVERPQVIDRAVESINSIFDALGRSESIGPETRFQQFRLLIESPSATGQFFSLSEEEARAIALRVSALKLTPEKLDALLKNKPFQIPARTSSIDIFNAGGRNLALLANRLVTENGPKDPALLANLEQALKSKYAPQDSVAKFLVRPHELKFPEEPPVPKRFFIPTKIEFTPRIDDNLNWIPSGKIAGPRTIPLESPLTLPDLLSLIAQTRVGNQLVEAFLEGLKNQQIEIVPFEAAHADRAIVENTSGFGVTTSLVRYRYDPLKTKSTIAVDLSKNAGELMGELAYTLFRAIDDGHPDDIAELTGTPLRPVNEKSNAENYAYGARILFEEEFQRLHPTTVFRSRYQPRRTPAEVAALINEVNNRLLFFNTSGARAEACRYSLEKLGLSDSPPTSPKPPRRNKP